MLRRYGQLNVALLFAGDALALLAAWLLAYWARFGLEFIPVARGYPPVGTYLVVLPFVLAAWLAAARITHLYHHRAGLKSAEEMTRLSYTMAWAVLILIALTFFYRGESYSRLVVVYFMALGPALLFLVRRVMWSAIRRLRRRGVDMRRILVAGVSPLAQRTADRLEAYRYLGFQVIGHLSEEDAPPARVGGRPVLGRIGEAKAVAEREEAVEVYVALPAEKRQEQERLLNDLADSSVDLRVVPDLLDHMRLNAGIEELDGLPVVLLSQTPLLGWSRVGKRAMDAALGSLIVALLSPVLFLIAALVKLSSPGPVLYAQERMGLDGVRFQMYKFRSMRADAERETGAVWARPGDDRRTWLGGLLRRTSLDELPQLLNVIRGEMSLVGPRPERPVFVEQFRRKVPGYMLRHKMKSGMTGWAQVNGWRGDTSIEKRIEYDLYYIEHWSLGLDLKIMWLTVWKGFVSRNAY
ncbi:MAG: undecaprenyl-phosphate glucose phosphotransferase [Candidatus Tectomicrobia bacterium RIFCSPLOWO2_12_FULL_69_37]|nr:MAG: undecaprenyl-phosphate glucose phosphotransferase [Candidatus Tectomicrobia bacterium RIFCSPLOWO2_12_FULL_69_37]OGL65192.1 MAG: undecaprenyl-phosphate glucose phosphotransferase [Candidatus Tectomicrobia bacterium RIFCSPLOWO2_02_FULL_70_19]